MSRTVLRYFCHKIIIRATFHPSRASSGTCNTKSNVTGYVGETKVTCCLQTIGAMLVYIMLASIFQTLCTFTIDPGHRCGLSLEYKTYQLELELQEVERKLNSLW